MAYREYIGDPYLFKIGYQKTQIYSRKDRLHTNNSPDLTFETVHPANKDTNFIHSYLGPDYQFTHTFSYEEAYQTIYQHDLHQHDFFELLYVIRGEMYQRIESERHLYPEGSLCLLNCNIRHQEEFSTDFRVVFLRIPISLIQEILNDVNSYFFQIELKLKGNLQEQFFKNNLDNAYFLRKEYIDFIPCESNPDVKKQMYDLFDQLTHQFLFPQIGSSYLIKHLLIQILQQLSISSNYRTVPLSVGTDAEADLFSFISILLKNKNGHISRSELENELSYNGDYMNRIVKKFTGLSLHQYGMTFCMKEAASLLRNTDMNISDICEKLHFSNQTHFYKLFQSNYHMTPKKYREECKRTM